MTEQRKLATIMAIDVAGYARSAEADQGAAAAAVARLRTSVEEIIPAFGGRVFNTAGDGVMIEFPAATSGVQAAVMLLKESQAGIRQLPQIRIGLHLGEVIVAEDGDLLGHGVNVAARLQALAEPGTAAVSGAVHDQLRSAADILLTSQGKVQLEKMSERMEVFSLAPGRRVGLTRVLLRRAQPAFLAGLGLIALAIVAWRSLGPPPASPAMSGPSLASDQFAFNVINRARVCEYAMFARDFPGSPLVSLARSRAGDERPCDEATLAGGTTSPRSDGRETPPFRDLHINDRAIVLIKQAEGLQLNAVELPDSGMWSIGYSHSGEDVHPGMTITEAEADRLLRADLRFFETIVKSMVTAPMNEDEFSAIVDLAYNIGTEAFRHSNVLRALNRGDRAGAAAAFRGWDRIDVNGVSTEDPHLTQRRETEREIFLSQPPS